MAFVAMNFDIPIDFILYQLPEDESNLDHDVEIACPCTARMRDYNLCKISAEL